MNSREMADPTDANPFFAVIIPCRNDPGYIEECLASLISQTWRSWEAVVVDDASTYGSLDRVVSTLDDDRVSLIRLPRSLGPGGARNRGIARTTAPWILPLDSDDRLNPEHLDAVADAIDRCTDADCIYTDLWMFKEPPSVQTFEVRDEAELSTWQWIPPGALFTRRLWQVVGGYCEEKALRHGHEDWDFWLSAFKRDVRVVRVPRPLFQYRIHAGSLSARQGRHEYALRRLLYLRHSSRFRGLKGRSFLAEGAACSSQAAWMSGENLRAISLAVRALLLWPRREQVLGLAKVLSGCLRLGHGPERFPLNQD